MSSSSESEEEDEEMEVDEREEEESEEEDSDDDESYQIPLSQEQNFVREQNIKALRDGTVTIRYASVLSILKPPEPDEVILKRHFQPLVPGGAVQTGAQSRVFGLMFSFSFSNDSLPLVPRARKERRKGDSKVGTQMRILVLSLFLSLSLSLFQASKKQRILTSFSSLSLFLSLSFFLNNSCVAKSDSRS